MASLTVTASAICGGGNHVTFAVTGAKTATVKAEINDMQDPVTDEDLESFVKVLCKLCRAGKTNAQLKTALQAGLTVTA